MRISVYPPLDSAASLRRSPNPLRDGVAAVVTTFLTLRYGLRARPTLWTDGLWMLSGNASQKMLISITFKTQTLQKNIDVTLFLQRLTF